MVASGPAPLPTILLSFADEEDDYAERLPVKTLEPNVYEARVEATRIRLNSRCKGFLEASAPGRQRKSTDNDWGTIHPQTVRYLHRIVKEFLETETRREKITKAIKSSFNPHLRLCAGYLAVYKTCHYRGLAERLDDETQKMALGCLMQLSNVPSNMATRMYPILEQLERHTPPLAGFSGHDVRELWVPRILMNVDEGSKSSSALAPTTRALLLD